MHEEKKIFEFIPEKLFPETINFTKYNAAIYIRLSKEDANNGESQSVTNQRHLLQEFSKKHNIYIFDEYIDDGWSGGNFDRPAFNRMIFDIELKKVNMVITKDMSRLGRDYIQTGHYIEKYFPEKQVRYISLLDGIDTGIDSYSNDITPFKAIMNDLYAKDISKKIKSVKHDKQKKGLFIGGKAPYGYILSETKKNTLFIDQEAAKIVKMIFEMAIAGKSCREIAGILNEKQILSPAVYANLNITRKGKYTGLWSSERVTYTLKNQMYIGDMVQGMTKKINYKSRKYIKLPKEQWIIIESTHPPIIEKKQFDKVQLLINSRKKTRKRTYDYLLKGMIFCKECGGQLGVINRVLSGNRQTLYFVCRTYQRFTKAKLCTCHCSRVEDVTDIVVSHIKEICKQNIDREGFSKMLQIFIEEANKEKSLEFEIQKLTAKINNIASNMDKLYMDKLNGILEDIDFERLYTRLKDERIETKSKFEYLESSTSDKSVYNYDINEIIERFIQSASENRELFLSLVEKIEMTEDMEIYIHFCFAETNIFHKNNG